MLVRKPSTKKKTTTGATSGISLDSSLTSIEWLPKMQIGEHPLPSSSSSSASSAATTTAIATLPNQQSLPNSSLPITLSRETNISPKIEANEIDISATAVHLKPPYSYVTLIRQAILSAAMQKMTLNEIYQWIVESYPYFRTAPPKWKNSIRHNLSLNKCFKRLQRSTNDPGKGSYWAVDESNENNHQSNSRKRRFGDMPPSLHILPSSPTGIHQQSTIFYTNNNPMICGDVSSIGGQSSADESDSTMSLVANNNLIEWDDLNVDLSASFRRFREQILEGQSTPWITTTDTPPINTVMPNSWNHEQVFPHAEANNFFESFKLGSNGEINWNDADVKPYAEVADGFRTNTALQQQGREKLINLASSLSSFFDYSGFTSFAHNRNPNESMTANRFPGLSNRTISEPLTNHNPLPVVIEDDGFDWDSIT